MWNYTLSFGGICYTLALASLGLPLLPVAWLYPEPYLHVLPRHVAQARPQLLAAGTSLGLEIWVHDSVKL